MPAAHSKLISPLSGGRGSHRGTQQGVGLIEVLIALVVFALGVVGMAGLQLKTLSITMDSSQRTYVVAKAQDVADRIRSSGVPVASYLSPAGVDGAYNSDGAFCETVPSTSCTDTATSNVDTCSPAQMAEFDLYDAFCVGNGSADDVVDGSLDNNVADWQVVISCSYVDPTNANAVTSSTTCNQFGATVNITTTWTARSSITTVAAGASTSGTSSATATPSTINPPTTTTATTTPAPQDQMTLSFVP